MNLTCRSCLWSIWSPLRSCWWCRKWWKPARVECVEFLYDKVKDERK